MQSLRKKQSETLLYDLLRVALAFLHPSADADEFHFHATSIEIRFLLKSAISSRFHISPFDFRCARVPLFPPQPKCRRRCRQEIMNSFHQLSLPLSLLHLVVEMFIGDRNAQI